jgi:hypothetical protein
MTELRAYMSSLADRPWTRALWQGVAIGIGIAIAGVIARRSAVFVVVSAVGVGLVMGALFGFLLRIQRRGRSA